MKIQKYADRYRGRQGTFKTSGGGNFEGYIGGYDPESNTIDVWNGFKKTKVDADKIVSVQAKSAAGIVVFIAIWIVGMFLLLDITSPNRDSRYNDYRYERYE